MPGHHVRDVGQLRIPCAGPDGGGAVRRAIEFSFRDYFQLAAMDRFRKPALAGML
jgi:hypothetical protein